MSIVFPEGMYMLWDGVNWNVLNAPPSDTLVSTDAGNTARLGSDMLVYVGDTAYDARFLKLAGGTLSGPVVLPANAVNDLEAVPKRQLDTALNGHIAAADPHPVYLTKAEGDGLYRSVSAAAGHTIQEEGASLTTRANLNFIGSGVTAADDAANNRTNVTINALDQATADANYVNVAGDVMTGDLELPESMVQAFRARVETIDHPTGNTISVGANFDMGTYRIIDTSDPVNPTDAATKRYVDNLTSTAVAFGTASTPSAGLKFNIGSSPAYRGNGFSTSGGTVSAQYNGYANVSGYFAWTMNTGVIYMSVDAWYQVSPGTTFQGQIDYTLGTTQEFKSGIFSSAGGPTVYLATLRPPASTYTGVTSVTAYLTFKRL